MNFCELCEKSDFSESYDSENDILDENGVYS